MKYFQQTESVIQLIHKLNQQNCGIIFYIHVMAFSRNAQEFDAFSEELREKLRTCRFYAKSTEGGEHFVFGSNHYFVNSVEMQKFIKIEVPQKNSNAHISFLINTIIPQCPTCASVQDIRKKLLMLNSPGNERIGSIFRNIGSDNLIETELIGKQSTIYRRFILYKVQHCFCSR